MRRALLIAHRWLGLPASAVLAVVGGTGAVMLLPEGSLVRRAAGRLHETLALGRFGAAIVLAATTAAVLLQLSGLYLWWRRKSFRVRIGDGWRPALLDLHHAAGIVTLPIMLMLALTALGMTWLAPGGLRYTIATLHTAGLFPAAIKAGYAVGSLGFLIQGVSGVVMWWNARRR